MDINCPGCQSNAYKRNGYTRHGKQNHRCLDCGKQFSVDIDDTLLFSKEPASFDLEQLSIIRDNPSNFTLNQETFT